MTEARHTQPLPPRLEGQVALVTGSGRGIGRAIAVRLAREGADIVINYGHNADEAEETRKQVEAVGRKTLVVGANLAKVEDVKRLIDEGARQFGHLDVLVNNAGTELKADFTDVTEEDYDKVLDLNLKGVFFGMQAFVKHLLDGKRKGRIITISSVHEEIPFPGFAPYCASKSALRVLTRNLAVELGKHGITVNSIAPGAIETEMNRALAEDKPKRDALLAQIPLGRLGTPDDVAGLAAFLASADADYVTGSTFFVDGGLTWHYQE